MDHVIELQNVSWTRESTTVLHKIDWTVRKGEHWAIFGLNGSGKTTILNMINGYIWPSRGKVSVLGHPFGTVDLRELRKSIGWVSSSLQERIRPIEKSQHVVVSGLHASIGLYEKPTEEHLSQAYRLMEEFGCGHLLDRMYQTCSQGEKQKLLIARALMAAPELLILDEACNGLDFMSREALLTSISKLAADSNAPTILYVTHHVEEILPSFTHTLLIRKGHVFASGLTADVLNRDQLTRFFETPVDITWKNDRPWLALL